MSVNAKFSFQIKTIFEMWKKPSKPSWHKVENKQTKENN